LHTANIYCIWRYILAQNSHKQIQSRQEEEKGEGKGEREEKKAWKRDRRDPNLFQTRSLNARQGTKVIFQKKTLCHK